MELTLEFGIMEGIIRFLQLNCMMQMMQFGGGFSTLGLGRNCKWANSVVMFGVLFCFLFG